MDIYLYTRRKYFKTGEMLYNWLVKNETIFEPYFSNAHEAHDYYELERGEVDELIYQVESLIDCFIKEDDHYKLPQEYIEYMGYPFMKYEADEIGFAIYTYSEYRSMLDLRNFLKEIYPLLDYNGEYHTVKILNTYQYEESQRVFGEEYYS